MRVFKQLLANHSSNNCQRTHSERPLSTGLVVTRKEAENTPKNKTNRTQQSTLATNDPESPTGVLENEPDTV